MTASLRPLAGLLLVMAGLLIVPATPGWAVLATTPPCSLWGVCAEGEDGGIGVGGSRRTPGQPGTPGPGGMRDPRGDTEPVRQEPLPSTYYRYSYAPACEGNTAEATGGLCQLAVASCPQPGDTRYWVWQRLVTRATGELGPWERLPGSQCLAVVPDPADPPAPTRAPIEAVPPLVEEEFQQLPLLAGSAQVQPTGVTLVNFPTNFYTEVPKTEQFELTILDYPVVVDAHVKGYVWHWGDGTTTKGGTDTRGAPYPDLAVTHEYKQAQDRAVRVDVIWGGSFSIEGGPVQPIQGTVTIEGNATALNVVESRSQLVSGG